MTPDPTWQLARTRVHFVYVTAPTREAAEAKGVDVDEADWTWDEQLFSAAPIWKGTEDDGHDAA